MAVNKLLPVKELPIEIQWSIKSSKKCTEKKTMTEDIAILICMPVETIKNPVASQEGTCHICKTPVWVSDTMWPVVGRAEVLPTCLLCVDGLVEAQGEVAEAGLHPAQVEAMAKDGTLPLFKRLVGELNKRGKFAP